MVEILASDELLCRWSETELGAGSEFSSDKFEVREDIESLKEIGSCVETTSLDWIGSWLAEIRDSPKDMKILEEVVLIDEVIDPTEIAAVLDAVPRPSDVVSLDVATLPEDTPSRTEVGWRDTAEDSLVMLDGNSNELDEGLLEVTLVDCCPLDDASDIEGSMTSVVTAEVWVPSEDERLVMAVSTPEMADDIPDDSGDSVHGDERELLGNGNVEVATSREVSKPNAPDASVDLERPREIADPGNADASRVVGGPTKLDESVRVADPKIGALPVEEADISREPSPLATLGVKFC